MKSYVIAATPRSGSTLLMKGLLSTGRLGMPRPYFNIMDEMFTNKEEEYPECCSGDMDCAKEFIARMKAKFHSENGVFGAKLLFHHMERFFLERGIDPDVAFEHPRYIYLTRENIVLQAVSLSIARQTQAWYHYQESMAEPQYDKYDIARQVARINYQNAQWDYFFHTRGIEPLRLTYEKLCQRYPETITAVMEYVGVDTVPVDQIPPKQTKKQGNTMNDEWADRFCREMSGDGR